LPTSKIEITIILQLERLLWRADSILLRWFITLRLCLLMKQIENTVVCLSGLWIKIYHGLLQAAFKFVPFSWCSSSQAESISLDWISMGFQNSRWTSECEGEEKAS
jgi:hypothetical protein